MPRRDDDWRPPARDMTGMDGVLTEQRNPRSSGLDHMTAIELVDLLNSEDRTVAGAVASQREQIARAVELVVERFRRGGRLFYVGAGTSGRLGVLDAAECPPTFGTDPEMVQGLIAGGYEALVRAQEGAEDDRDAGALELRERGLGADDVVIGIATSGVTPYVHAALAEARAVGAATVFITCSPPGGEGGGSEPADVTIAPLTGPEVVTGSTRLKAGTATKLVLNSITTSAMILLGKTWGNLMVDLTATCDKLRDRALRILVETTGMSYNDAADLMVRASGSVKVAIAMARAGVSRKEAERLLDESDGHVRAALEKAGVDPDPR